MSKPDGYVAREDKNLVFFGTKPMKTGSTWSTGFKNNKTLLPYNIFPKLKDTDEPQPVYLSPHRPEDVARLVEAVSATLEETKRKIDRAKNHDDISYQMDDREYDLAKALKAFKEVEDGG